jgi:hypothetical protein
MHLPKHLHLLGVTPWLWGIHGSCWMFRHSKAPKPCLKKINKQTQLWSHSLAVIGLLVLEVSMASEVFIVAVEGG